MTHTAGGEGVRGCTCAASAALPAGRLVLGLLMAAGGDGEGLGAGLVVLSAGAARALAAWAGAGSQRGAATSSRQAAAAAARVIAVGGSTCRRGCGKCVLQIQLWHSVLANTAQEACGAKAYSSQLRCVGGGAT